MAVDTMNNSLASMMYAWQAYHDLLTLLAQWRKCVSKNWVIIGLDNGLVPVGRQAII